MRRSYLDLKGAACLLPSLPILSTFNYPLLLRRIRFFFLLPHTPIRSEKVLFLLRKMGVGGKFWDMLKPYARQEGTEFLRDKKVVVDLSFWIVQHETAIRGACVRNPHIRITFFRTLNLFSKVRHLFFISHSRFACFLSITNFFIQPRFFPICSCRWGLTLCSCSMGIRHH